jgi:hypothetical protein
MDSTKIKQLKVTHLLVKRLALPENITMSQKKLMERKQPSLFYPFVTDDQKEVDDIDSRYFRKKFKMQF